MALATAAAGCSDDDPAADDNNDGSSSSSSSSSGESSSGGASSSSGGSSGASSSSGGSSSGGSSSGGASGPFSSTCQAQAEWVVGCDSEANLDEERAHCLEEAACLDHGLRDGAAEALSDCLLARECATSEDYCYADVGAEVGGDEVVAYGATCMAKWRECGDGDDGFIDDYCGTAMGLFKPELMTALEACFDRPCAEVNDCFDAAFVALHPSCD